MSNKNDYILITGGAGFIGSHLSEALLADNKKILCIDNFNDYYDPAIKRHNIVSLLDNKNFHLLELDLRNFDDIHQALEEFKPSKIIHLAAQGGVRNSMRNPLLYEELNIKATLNLLENIKKLQIKNFIFASTSSVYGINPQIPFKENMELLPVSFYAATKVAGEVLCSTYHRTYGFPLTILRFFTVYGPRQRPDMAIHNFTRNIINDIPINLFGDGTSRRDYTYISDIIQGISAALEANYDYEIFNLGESYTILLKELVALIEQAVGKNANINYLPDQKGDVPITYADITHTQKYLNYKPNVSIEEGIIKFVEWYKNNN